MSDRNVGDQGVGEGFLELRDEVDNDIGVSTDTSIVGNTGNGVTVQVLATDGHADNQIGKLLAILVKAGLQGIDLVVNGGGARSPDTQQKLGFGLDGGLEGLDGVAGGVSLNVCVESHSIESDRSTVQILCRGHLGNEVALELGRVVVLQRARVEAIVVLGRRDSSNGAGRKGSGKAHGERVWVCCERKWKKE